LHRYVPERAQLGLKTLEQSLPSSLVAELEQIFENMTPSHHNKAVEQIRRLVIKELDWIKLNISQDDQIIPFLEKMLE